MSVTYSRRGGITPHAVTLCCLICIAVQDHGLKKRISISYIKFTLQVLRWFGYFREQVSDSTGEEDRRVRHIAVHYYLEDDTVDICEPRQDNSGLLQVGASGTA